MSRGPQKPKRVAARGTWRRCGANDPCHHQRRRCSRRARRRHAQRYADVVGQHVDVVVALHGDANLKLARQEQTTVDGFGRSLKVGAVAVLHAHQRRQGLSARHDLFPVEPHVVIRPALRRQQISDVLGQLLRDIVFWSVGVRRRRRVTLRLMSPQRRRSEPMLRITRREASPSDHSSRCRATDTSVSSSIATSHCRACWPNHPW